MNFDQSWMADILELQKKAAELAKGQKPVEEVQSLVMEVVNKWGIANLPWQEEWNSTNPFWTTGHPEPATRENWNVDITETKNHVIVEAVIPGIEGINDLSIKLQGDNLYITGKSSLRTYASDNDDGAFGRKVRLPAKVSALGAEASYQEEKLKITLPKTTAEDGEIIHLSFFHPNKWEH